MAAPKKQNPFAKMAVMKTEKKEGKKEPKESKRMMGREKMMGMDKPMPFKCGGKVKGK